MSSNESRNIIKRAPLLETKRLILREYQKSDLNEYIQVWSDPSVVRYIGGKTKTPQESLLRLCAQVGRWCLDGMGFWIIEDKATGTFAGEVGCAIGLRDLDPKFSGIPEVGWLIAPRHQKKGYATEALSCAMAWIKSELKHEKVMALIAPEHVASIRVAEKCGFKNPQKTVVDGIEAVAFWA